MDLRAVNPKTDKMEVVLMSTPEGNVSGPPGGEDGSVSDQSEPKKKVPPGTLHARASKTSVAVCSALKQKSAELDKKQQQGKKKGTAVSAEGTPSNTEHASAKDHMEPRAAKRARKAEAAVQEGLKPERTRRAIAETREHLGAVASKTVKLEREQSAAKAAHRAARQKERAVAEAEATAKLAKQERRRAATLAKQERKAAKAANKLAKQDENAAAVGTAEEQSAAKATNRPGKAARKAAEQRAPEEQEGKTLVAQDEASKEVLMKKVLMKKVKRGQACSDDVRSIDDYDEAAATDDDDSRSITSTSESASEGKERHSDEDSVTGHAWGACSGGFDRACTGGM